MRYTFEELLELAAAESKGADQPTRATIVKELLHYDILYAISASQLSRGIVFQGGTALRLAYGGQRYSEDLDFVCGAGVGEPFHLGDMPAILEKHMQERYGLSFEVHPPPATKSFHRDSVTVKRWRFVMAVPGFAGSQKIHLEFCNVPAHDAAPVLLQPRYGFLGDQYGGIVLSVESEHEILADKLVALAGRAHLKARDVWDIRWLTQRGIEADVDLIRRKAADYGMTNLATRLQTAVDRLRTPQAGRAFVNEMQRFVSPSLIAAIAQETPPGKSWLQHAARIAESVRQALPAD